MYCCSWVNSIYLGQARSKIWFKMWIFYFLSLKQFSMLTLNMLNCFKDYEICIHISYHILDCIQQKKTKFTMEEPHMLPILYCQCHVCWCPGDFRSQGISRYGINPQSRNIPSPASEELRVKWMVWFGLVCYLVLLLIRGMFLLFRMTDWQ